MKTTSLILTLIITFFPVASSAQQQSSTISMHGTVSRVVILSPSHTQIANANDGTLTAQVIAYSRERIILCVNGARQLSASSVQASLLLKSNTSYELRAQLVSFASAPSISLSLANVRATGAWVIPGAVESVRAAMSQVDVSRQSIMLASGSRISRGPASSPNNAIEIELNIETSPSAAESWSADVAIEIIPR